MLKGIDVSHWNNNNVITSDLDFVICKATEGKNFKDKTFNTKLDLCKKLNIGLVGAYHYAKTNTDVLDNVKNFLETIKNREEFANNMILALDIEGEDINRSNTWEWVKDWCDLVYANTGIKPLVYTSAAYTKNMLELFTSNYGLWVAHWNVKKPKINIYPFWAFWQYAVINNVDCDYFNGTKEQYLKYCRRER